VVNLADLKRYEKQSTKAKTLVFDFDETIAKVKYNSPPSDFNYDHRLDILTKKQTIKVFVKLRPHLVKVLKELKQHFELVLFSSAKKSCLASIMKIIVDKEGLFEHMLFRN
jgi:TFIIF-interacting CTD phosphatase-like protein